MPPRIQTLRVHNLMIGSPSKRGYLFPITQRIYSENICV